MSQSLFLLCLAGLRFGSSYPAAQSVSQDPAVYVIASTSRFEVITGKAGFLGFAGHEHLIRARGFSGRVVYDRQNPAGSRVEILVRADSLEVLTPPDTEEIRLVTAAMRSQVLEVERYRDIRFITTAATPTRDGFRLRADLTIHGQTRPVTIEVRTHLTGDTLRATAKFSVLQTDFGI